MKGIPFLTIINENEQNISDFFYYYYFSLVKKKLTTSDSERLYFTFINHPQKVMTIAILKK